MKTQLPLVFSITSGKGGVGKTNLSVNIASALAQKNKRVVLLDADLGLANVDVLLGLTPQYNLLHLFHEDVALSSVLMDTPYGFKILPASSGVSEMLNLDSGQKLTLLDAVDDLEHSIDYLIIDTGAGIHENVLYFNMAVQERIVVLTPEPTSLTDAYALIKVMQKNHNVKHFKVVVNMANSEKEAKEVFMRLYKACDHFLEGTSLDLLGVVPRDPAVRQAVIEQKPFVLGNKAAPVSRAIMQLADNIQQWDIPDTLDGNIKFFWKQLLFQENSTSNTLGSV